MATLTLVFALQITYWDAPPDSGCADIIAKPTLETFSDAALAASSKEGINIVEGDLWFFAADGSALEAVFSEQPYVDPERLRYFAGKYSLQTGHGKTLREMISDILSDVPMSNAQILVLGTPSDEWVHEHGWSDAETMRSQIKQALEVAVPDLAMLSVFEGWQDPED